LLPAAFGIQISPGAPPLEHGPTDAFWPAVSEPLVMSRHCEALALEAIW
jgi:hypothetical protein